MTPASADAKRAQIARIIRDAGPIYGIPEDVTDSILDVLAEPTDAMRHAGMLARDAQSQRRSDPLTHGEQAADTWRAMVAAIRGGA